MSIDPIEKIEDRLRALELQSQRNSAHIESEVSNLTKLMEEIRDLIKRHDMMFFGTNGSPGLMTRIDRLEQADSTRRWSIRAGAGVLFGLVIKTLWELIIHH